MKVTSEKLRDTQKTLEQLAKNEIDNPTMTNYSKLNNLLKVVKYIDKLRRETWNNETFGAYEELADNTIKMINSDDIPF